LDANVIVSAFPASGGILSDLLNRWRSGLYQIVIAEPLLEEVMDAWRKPYWLSRFPPVRPENVERLLRRHAEWVQIGEVVRGAATHPEDDVIVSIALSAQADCIVTGDKRFRGKGNRAGVALYFPREFLDLLDRQID
jgi:predicted nucleic acid-binding protein